MKKVMLVEDEDFILQGIKYIIDWEALSTMKMQPQLIMAKKPWKYFRKTLQILW